MTAIAKTTGGWWRAWRGWDFIACCPESCVRRSSLRFSFRKIRAFSFNVFYDRMKQRRFVIYPGKVTNAETFRIGNIGHVFPEDMDLLVHEIGEVMGEMGVKLKSEVGSRRSEVGMS